MQKKKKKPCIKKFKQYNCIRFILDWNNPDAQMLNFEIKGAIRMHSYGNIASSSTLCLLAKGIYLGYLPLFMGNLIINNLIINIRLL